MNKTKNKKNINPKTNTKTNNSNKKKSTTKKNNTKIKSTIKKDIIYNDKDYKNAEKLYKEKKYNEAYEIYLNLNEKYLKNKKIYKRLLECLTKDFTYKEKTKEFKNNYNDLITTYKILATKKEVNYITEKEENYKNIKTIKTGSKFLIISLLGWFGVHKFIEKNYLWGIIYLLTFGLFGIGVIVDLINDYAMYEDEKQLNILRYIISVVILLFGLINHSKFNTIYFILISILTLPIIFSKLLKVVPSIIKIIIIIILLYLGFKTNEVITFIPTSYLGTWKTDNENTNFKEVIIHNNKSTVKFNDRKDQIGNNEYDEEKNILKIYVNATTFYKFKIDKKDNKLCIYNESETCIISFKK